MQMTDTNEASEMASSTVVSLADRMRAAPMAVPHATPPKPKWRVQSEPSEVTELRAPWQATDRLLGLLQMRTEDTMRALMTVMGPDEAREAVLASVRHGVLDGLKAEIKGCGNE
jgi:hypothetical protein